MAKVKKVTKNTRPGWEDSGAQRLKVAHGCTLAVARSYNGPGWFWVCYMAIPLAEGNSVELAHQRGFASREGAQEAAEEWAFQNGLIVRLAT